MKHYLQSKGRCTLLLVLLMCLCSGLWAQEKGDYTLYYDISGNRVYNTEGASKVIAYTLRDIPNPVGAGYKVMLVSCEPVNEDDFKSGERINLVIPVGGVIGTNIFGFAYNLYEPSNFWANHLESVTFGSEVSEVYDEFMGYRMEEEDGDGTILLKYRYLTKIDFSKVYNIDNVKFSADAFKDFDAYMPSITVSFKDGRSGLTYSLKASNGNMQLTGFEYKRPQIVVFGQKSFGGLTGTLTSLGGVFTGYTANDFSVAITDGLRGLGDNEFKGSSLVALSLPKSLGTHNLMTSTPSCGTGVIDDCPKLEKVFAYAYNVPYIVRWSDGVAYVSYDRSSDLAYDFGVSGKVADNGYGLSESDFSNRWASLSGDIAFTSAVQLLKDFVVRTDFTLSSAVGGEAFSGNTAITGITIYNEQLDAGLITTINDYGFKDCTGLKKVTISTPYNYSNGFTLRQSCFEGCTSLTDVTIGGNVRIIAYNSFKGCSSLTNITFEEPAGDKTLYIGSNCFEGCAALQKLDLRGRTVLNGSNGKRGLPDYCFKDCPSLTTLLLDHDVQELGTGFNEGTQLGTVYFSKTSDGAKLDYVWTNLNKMELADGYSYNGQTVCDGMADGDKVLLRGVTAASGTVTLEGGDVSFCPGNDFAGGKLCRVLDKAFTSITSVELPYGLEYGADCFDLTKLTNLGIYATGGLHVSSYQSFADGKSVGFEVDRCDPEAESLTVPYDVAVSNVTGYVGRVGHNSEDTQNLWGATNSKLKTLTFAESTTTANPASTFIYPYAFSDCTALTTVNFPKRKYEIFWYAFSDCPLLKAADLAYGFYIHHDAFHNCPSIAMVRAGVNMYSGYAFENNVFSCDEDKPNTTLKSIVLLQSENTIAGADIFGENAFSGLSGVSTVVFDLDPTKSNYTTAFESFKKAMRALNANSPTVYISAAAYNRLSEKPANFADAELGNVTWKSADDYRFMATSTASGEALDKGYGTICLPRTVDMAASYNVKTLYTAQYDGTSSAVTLVPVAADGVKAGLPYIYSRSDDDPSGLVVFSGNDANGTVDEPLADGVLTGTFTAKTAPVGSYVLQTDNMFHIVGSTSIAVAPYRAYMTAPAAGSAEARLSIIEGEPTAVKGVTDNAATDAAAPMYNLSGQRIAAPAKGQIYIVKGKKAIQR